MAQSIVSLATIFVVPSLRVEFAPNAVISPWVSGGFGYGISEGSEFFGNEVRNSSRYQSTGAAQFGAGVDVRTPIRVWFPISLRGEVRDYCAATNLASAPQSGEAARIISWCRVAWSSTSRRGKPQDTFASFLHLCLKARGGPT